MVYNEQRALRSNPVYAHQVPWSDFFDEIVEFLVLQGAFPFDDRSPGPEDFCLAVFDWQRSNGLTADGMLGPNTFRAMRPRFQHRYPQSLPVPDWLSWKPGQSRRHGKGGQSATRLLAEGAQMFEMIRRLELISMQGILHGEGVIIRPMTVFNNRLMYVTSTTDEAIYVRDNKLFAESHLYFYRNSAVIGTSAAHVAQSTAWVIPVSKAYIAFCEMVVPGGRAAGAVVRMASVAAFWANHHHEISTIIDHALAIVSRLRLLYNRYPELGNLLLISALQQTGAQIADELRREGLARFVMSHADTDSYGEDVARLVGALLKFGVSRYSGLSIAGFNVTAWLTKRGLVKLAQVSIAMVEVRSIVRLARRAAGLTSGPPIQSNYQQLLARFIQELGNSGITVSQAMADRIVREGYSEDREVETSLEELQSHSSGLANKITTLASDYEHEVL